MFQFPWCSFPCLCVQQGILEVLSSGFPHSEIPGSTPICDSPRHIGAYPVLRRRLVPGHPPYALVRLIILRPISLSLESFRSPSLRTLVRP